MSNDTNPGSGNRAGALKVLWLFCAFIPSVVAISCLKIPNPGQDLLAVLLFVDLVGSFAGAAGLLSGSISNKGVQSVVICFLATFFFILNIVITVFVGCSGMGRVAP
jgi:hypothetical protein